MNEEDVTDSPNTTVNYSNNAESSIYKLHNLYEFEYYVLGVGTVVLCIFGIIGNTLTLIVLTRRDMVSTTYTYLVALAVSDMMVLLTATLAVCLRTMGIGEMDVLVDDEIVPYIYPFLIPAALTCVYASVWITVALTLDRYLAVCHAMNTKIHCTIPSARKSIILIVFAALLYNIPTFFEYKIVYIDHNIVNNTNRTTAVMVPTAVGNNAVFREVYHTWLYVPVVWGIPFSVMFFMNMRLMYAVHKSKQKCKTLQQKKPPKGVDVTIMLIAVIVIFLICQTPYMVSVTMRALMPDVINSVAFIKFDTVTTLLIILNSSVNFLVYTLFGKRFRAKFLQLFCGSRYKNYMHALSQSYEMDPHRISRESIHHIKESMHRISRESVMVEIKKSDRNLALSEQKQAMLTIHNSAT